MPGICGIIATGNHTDLREDFTALFNAMCRFDHEKSQKYECNSAFFGMVSLSSAIKRNPAEKIISDTTSVFASTNPQLDDQQLVRGLVQNNFQRAKELTEGELLYALDWQTNPEILGKVYGNWSFAHYCRASKRLTLAREPFGTGELYYIESSKYFAYSSSLAALLALPDISFAPSERELALMLIPDRHREPNDNSTPFHRIKKLLCGCYLSIARDGPKITRYWSMDRSIPENSLNAADTVYRAKHLLQSAVNRATHRISDIGITLSAGLDSGVVSAMAANSAKNCGANISAYCSIPRFPAETLLPKNRFADESPYAELLAAQHPNIDLVTIRSTDITPLAGLAKSVECNPMRGSYTATNDYWFHSLFSAAASKNVSRILNGQSGNYTLSYGAPISVASLTQIIKFRRWNQLVSRIAHQQQIAALRNYLTLDNTAKIDRDYARYQSPINPALREQLDLQPEADSNQFTESNNRDDYRLKFIDPQHGHSDGWIEMSSMYGLDTVDPTADTEFTLFTLSIDTTFFLGPNLTNKHLARSIAKGLIPEKTRLMTKRGYQASDFGARLLHDSETMEDILADFRSDKAIEHYLNVDEMYKCWQELKTNRNLLIENRAWRYLFYGIGFGLFLRRWGI